ncbi:prolyl-tRNA synthetase associated domain-containing protein 1-like [Anneissia japonica]|uniref:prolyl-tRNA synthetase associated domain-containing protein 1-like n=1 Tax=Anneissia japonica TaxID=1529436 RepID=UPI0014255E00|nr:prolyl-tRNA synthetase associated domain-containing protein 1-like [Anneissia japonica]
MAAAERKVCHGGQAELMLFLAKEGITTKTYDHPEVFTVEAMMPHLEKMGLDGAISKNLFVRDKKKRCHWLITAHHNQNINLASVAKKLGISGGVRFADENAMVEKIGVGQGCVTPLAVFNDKNGDVKLVVEADFLKEGKHKNLHFHPMVNSATLAITPLDFVNFARATGHEPIVIDMIEPTYC